ncbi:Cutinase transcription factor 1 beta [Cladobotryum mycophilum]|uniref:Cutinase transcription factor 1 beta n=1 Tax=Cladobotryum mycophilum TaxID=491253 RepID=A0ABR0ST69_9HYPO
MDSSRAVSPSSPDKVDAKKTRAKHACRECNSRRVKCDVTEKQPCSNCGISGARCEILPSRRGRYPRRSRRLQQPSTSARIESIPPPPVHSLYDEGHTSSEATPPLTLATSSNTSMNHLPADRPQDDRQSNGPPPTPSSTPATGTLFFGESNPLTIVSVNNGSATRSENPGNQKPRFEFPIPSPPHSNSRAEGAGISPATMRYLQDEGALTIPDLQSCLPAIEAYFKWSHPSYPILDRAEVTRGLASMEISRMLLQGILFIGSTYCDDETITAMGFQDRWQAKTTFYTRARLLFHADWEKDGIVLIQSLFLMGFWRGGPAEVRDVRYWLGVVITFAESYGLHRSQVSFTPSTARSMGGNSHMARIRRRIWWSIYVRERQAAASLGLPSRIRDEDCDIEPLSPSDLESELSYVDSPFGSFTSEHIIYTIKMVEISKLLGKVIDLHFVPGRSPPTANEIEELNKSLQEWRDGLPIVMRRLSEEGPDSVWACLLHLAYNHLRLLIHRDIFLRNEEGSQGIGVVLKSARQICRIAEDMSTQGTLRYAQMHLISAVFSALCIHTMNIRRRTGVPRRIAEHRAETCLLCLKEVQRYWRINNKLLDLFLQYLDRSTMARLSHPDTTENEGGAEAGKSDPATSMPNNASSSSPPQGEASVDSTQSNLQDNLFDDQYLNLVNCAWEGEDGFGDLGMFLQTDDVSQAGSSLNFLGRSL